MANGIAQVKPWIYYMEQSPSGHWRCDNYKKFLGFLHR